MCNCAAAVRVPLPCGLKAECTACYKKPCPCGVASCLVICRESGPMPLFESQLHMNVNFQHSPLTDMEKPMAVHGLWCCLRYLSPCSPQCPPSNFGLATSVTWDIRELLVQHMSSLLLVLVGLPHLCPTTSPQAEDRTLGASQAGVRDHVLGTTRLSGVSMAAVTAKEQSPSCQPHSPKGCGMHSSCQAKPAVLTWVRPSPGLPFQQRQSSGGSVQLRG